jgi:hypothetical protein
MDGNSARTVFYLGSREMDVVAKAQRKIELVGGEAVFVEEPPEVYVRKILETPFQEVTGSRGHLSYIDYIPARVGNYRITHAKFNDLTTFLQAILRHDGLIDELVIHAHGMPLYIQGDKSYDTGWWPHDMSPDTLLNPDLADRLDCAITVHDLELNRKIASALRAKFTEDAYGTLLCCLTFANIERPWLPAWGCEFAKFLGIPMTGSVTTYSQGQSGVDYSLVSRKLITAYPEGEKVILRHERPRWTE